MQRLQCIGGPLYGQQYSHPHNEFIFNDKQTGKPTLYRKQILGFTPPQAFFVAKTISSHFAYQLALPLIKNFRFIFFLVIIQAHINSTK